MHFTLNTRLFLFRLALLRKGVAVGIKSTVPNAEGLHYLLFDFDGKDAQEKAFELPLMFDRTPVSIARTPHGFHAIVWKPTPFAEVPLWLLDYGADRVHVALGLKRGYWFLRTRGKMRAPPAMDWQPMRIELVEE